MREPGKDESGKCFLSFVLLEGENVLLIAKDNYLSTGVRSRNSLLALLQFEFPAQGCTSSLCLELWVQTSTRKA